MSALTRDAPVGQFVRWATNKRFFQYAEERDDFELPVRYRSPELQGQDRLFIRSSDIETPRAELEASETEQVSDSVSETSSSMEKEASLSEGDSTSELEKTQTVRSAYTARTQISRVGTRTALSKSISRADLEQQFSLATMERGHSRPIKPETLDNGTIVVNWYTTDDPDNPQNFSFAKKAVVLFQVMIYTMGQSSPDSVYKRRIGGGPCGRCFG